MHRHSEIIETMVPLIADLAEDGAAAVALAGSHGKGRADVHSDYDFRAYSHAYRGPDLHQTVQWKRFSEAMAGFQADGVRMDGIWMRSYGGVRRDLDAWKRGEAPQKDFEWTIWGYQLPTDLTCQLIVHDPLLRLAEWREELRVYPEQLRQAIFARYGEILSYWATDYHYASKVIRQDLVFLAGIAGKLTNAILQVIFAINRTYFPGDGWNLPLAAGLSQLPPDFTHRMTDIIEPGSGPDRWQRQRENIISMITDVEVLMAADDSRMHPTGVEELRTEAIVDHP